MASQTTTRRPTATDSRTALRLLAAECIEGAAEEHGVTTRAWLVEVQRLQHAVAHLSGLRREGAEDLRVAAAREQAALAMLMVMPVHASAKARLDEALSPAAHDGLRVAREQLAAGGDTLVDPWLVRPVVDTVHEALADRVAPSRLVAA